MTQPPDKQLSRRDALKLLGAAAGASVLANLPSKWSTPQSVAGVLPAHAASSEGEACEGNALHVAVTAATGPYSMFPGPTPPTSSVAATFPNNGYSDLQWLCPQTCVSASALLSGPGTLQLQVTILGNAPFPVFLSNPANGVNSSWWIYLHAPTGVSNEGPADGRSWTVAGCPDIKD